MAFDLEAIWSGIGYQDSGKLAELFPSAGLEARFVEIEQNVGEANDQAASLAPGFQNLAERDEELLFGGGFFLPSLFSFEPGLFSLSARQFFIGFCSVSIGLGLADALASKFRLLLSTVHCVSVRLSLLAGALGAVVGFMGLQPCLISLGSCLGNSISGGAALSIEVCLGGPLKRQFAGMLCQVHHFSSDAPESSLGLSGVRPRLLENSELDFGLAQFGLGITVCASPPSDLYRPARSEHNQRGAVISGNRWRGG